MIMITDSALGRPPAPEPLVSPELASKLGMKGSRDLPSEQTVKDLFAELSPGDIAELRQIRRGFIRISDGITRKDQPFYPFLEEVA